MIDFYYWFTPNGYKIAIFLEETGLSHRVIPVDISKGEQFDPEFLKIAPNNRLPAIVDHNPQVKGAPVSVFESGAILMYLAEKTGKFLPTELRGRYEVLEWLFWQVGGLGPMAGQNHYFKAHTLEKVPHAVERYVKETSRLYAVLDKRLKGREFIAETYSIADIATYPWIVPHELQSQTIEEYPNLKRWFESIKARPAVKVAYEKGDVYRHNARPDYDSPEARETLFSQSAETVRIT